MKIRILKKRLTRALSDKRKVERRKLDSHTRLDPRMFWARVMRIELSVEVWSSLQARHFSYWYMTPEQKKIIREEVKASRDKARCTSYEDARAQAERATKGITKSSNAKR